MLYEAVAALSLCLVRHTRQRTQKPQRILLRLERAPVENRTSGALQNGKFENDDHRGVATKLTRQVLLSAKLRLLQAFCHMTRMPDINYKVRVSDEAGPIRDRVWVHSAPPCLLDVEYPSDQEVNNYMKKIGSSHSQELLAAGLVSTDRLHAAPCKDIAFTSKAVWYVPQKAFVIYSRISLLSKPMSDIIV